MSAALLSGLFSAASSFKPVTKLQESKQTLRGNHSTDWVMEGGVGRVGGKGEGHFALIVGRFKNGEKSK